MADLKHVGRQINNKRRCIVAYRVVPKDPFHCLVVFTDSLDAADHDTLIKTVESNAGQNAYEFAEVMARTSLVDGKNMLSSFHYTGKLTKMPTSDIELTPNINSSVNLAELNKIVAEQKGVTVEDLAIQASGTQTNNKQPSQTQSVVEENAPTNNTSVLTDEQLAAQYRSQADAMYKEAKRLRAQAEELAPTKKKKTTESAQEKNIN